MMSFQNNICYKSNDQCPCGDWEIKRNRRGPGKKEVDKLFYYNPRNKGCW